MRSRSRSRARVDRVYTGMRGCTLADWHAVAASVAMRDGNTALPARQRVRREARQRKRAATRDAREVSKVVT